MDSSLNYHNDREINISPLFSYVIGSDNYDIRKYYIIRGGEGYTQSRVNVREENDKKITRKETIKEIIYLSRMQLFRIEGEEFEKLQKKLVLSMRDSNDKLMYDSLRDKYSITIDLIENCTESKNDENKQKRFYEIFPGLDGYFGEFNDPKQFDIEGKNIFNLKYVYKSIDGKYYIMITDKGYAFFVKIDDFEKKGIEAQSFRFLDNFYCKNIEPEILEDTQTIEKRFKYLDGLFVLSSDNKLKVYKYIDNKYKELLTIENINDIIGISRDGTQLYCSLKIKESNNTTTSTYSKRITLISIDIPKSDNIAKIISTVAQELNEGLLGNPWSDIASKIS